MKFLFLFIFFISSNIYCESNELHPVIDTENIEHISYDINLLEFKELIELRKKLKNYIISFESKKSENILDKELYEALMKYDDVRVKIIDVIDDIIREYNVSSDIKKTLLSYKETFSMHVRDNKLLVKNLNDYKSYDFRMGAVYLSMMSAFHDSEEKKFFYERLVFDKKNESTSIGQYILKLNIAHEKVILIKKERDNYINYTKALKKFEQIEKEISKR